MLTGITPFKQYLLRKKPMIIIAITNKVVSCGFIADCRSKTDEIFPIAAHRSPGSIRIAQEITLLLRIIASPIAAIAV